MIVDDDPLVSDFIRDALDDAGYRVVSTNSGADALELLGKPGENWAGIVTDVNVGRDSPLGWEIARRAGQIAPGLPVIYVGGDSAHQWTAQGVPLRVIISNRSSALPPVPDTRADDPQPRTPAAVADIPATLKLPYGDHVDITALANRRSRQTSVGALRAPPPLMRRCVL